MRYLARWWLVVVAAGAVYGVSIHYLQGARAAVAAPELLISIPRVAQILFFAGDRYLAANISGFRVLVADTSRMRAEDYAVQARLQSDVAWFNPAHEDNYYIAANILPWGGQRGLVAVTEDILRKAGAARPYDFLPYFHVGFIHYHFYGAPAEGARWLLAAAERTYDQESRWGLQAVAAKWIERGYETSAAANLVEAMAKGAPPGGFRHYLQVRADRLKTLAELRRIAAEFRSRYQRPAQGIDDLVRAGLLKEVPHDPLGVGYIMRGDGEPAFAGR